MTIGIIGAGSIGGALARHFARANLAAIISNHRGPDSLAELVAGIGASLRAGIASADVAAKTEMAALVDKIGFHGIDLGTLTEGGRAISVPGGGLTIQNLIRLD